MAKKKPLVCTIDYDTKDGTNWKASVLAYSIKEAIAYIHRNVKSVMRINTTEGGKEVDAFDDAVMNDYLVQKVVEEIEIEVPVEVIKEVYIDRNDGELICPWCKKSFKNDATLKTHCIKFHLKD